MTVISPYLYKTYNNKNELIILDSLNSKIYKVNQKKSKYIEELINNPEKDIKGILKEKKLVVDEKYDSFEKLYDDFQKQKNYLNLIILPTEKCNFRCTYCYETHEKQSMSKELQLAIVSYVKNEIHKYKALRVEWFGGEPLCAIEVVDYLSSEFIKICNENNKPYYASMTTNGYLLDLNTFNRMFRKNKVVKYQITLDGLKENHDGQRYLANKKGTFDTILNNLLEIKEKINSKFFNIIIRCNITKAVMNTFDDYISLISNNFGNDPRFEVLWKIAWEPNINKEQSGSSDHYCEQNDISICLQKCENKKLRFGTNKSQLMKYGNICYASNKNSLVIGSDGKLYKCTVAFDKDVNNIGQLNLDGTIQINKKKFEFWMTRKCSMKKEICKDCSIYPSCLGIYCNLNNEDKNGEFLCSGMKKNLDKYLELISNIDYFVEEWE